MLSGRYAGRVRWPIERSGIRTGLDSSHFSHERSLAYNGPLTRAGPNLSQSADHVKGTKEFDRIYRMLKPGSPERRMVDSSLDKLKLNMMAGDKIQRPQWPRIMLESTASAISGSSTCQEVRGWSTHCSQRTACGSLLCWRCS